MTHSRKPFGIATLLAVSLSVLTPVQAGSLVEAAPTKITLSPIGDKMVGDRVRARGSLSGASKKRIVSLQRKTGGSWETLLSRSKKNGAYRLPAVFFNESGTIKLRTTASYKRKLLAKSKVVTFRVMETDPTDPSPPTSPADTTAPTADLVLNPQRGPAPFGTVADGSGSRDNVGVTSYKFLWGDGTAASGPEVTSTAAHTYSTPGTYTVTLVVTDAAGNSATTSKSVTVTAAGPPPATDAAPVAKVTAGPSSGVAPLDVTIDAGASTDDRGITGYAFEFGDGSATAPQPASTVRHVYTAAGTYTIKVTVTDTAGQQHAATTTVTVSAPPEPPPPSPTTKPTVVSFTFDDTLSNQAAAMDVLSRHGMKATIYVNSPRIGTPNYLSRSQLDAYADAGHEIAGHSLDHKDLATLTTTEIRQQVCDDRADLMAMGYRVTSFAMPFGSTSSTVAQVIRDCGYNSARGVGGLRSPGYGCDSCPTAETIPPMDRWKARTNASVKSDTTLAMLKGYVTQAENDRGGWVPLVLHNVCEGCADTSITIGTFTAFVDWLSTRPATTQVKTVDQVIGGTLQPSPG